MWIHLHGLIYSSVENKRRAQKQEYCLSWIFPLNLCYKEQYWIKSPGPTVLDGDKKLVSATVILEQTGSFRQHEFIISQSWKLKSRIKMLAGLFSWERYRGRIFQGSLSLWLVDGYLLLKSLHVVFILYIYVCVSKFLLLIRAPIILD